MRGHFFAAALIASLAPLSVACGPAASPDAAPTARFGKVFVEAVEAEQTDPASPERWLDALDQAARDPHAPGSLALASAALDALVTLDAPGLDAVGGTAVAFRSREGMAIVVKRLERIYASADTSGGGPAELVLIRGAIASALHELALHVGDAHAAEAWSDRRGCATAATIFGPLDWAPLTTLTEKSALAPSGALPASLPGIAPFAAEAYPIVARADQCMIDTSAPSNVEGLRLAVVDFDNPRSQRAYFSLTTSVAAVLDVGGVTTLRRGFDAGGHNVTRYGSIDLAEGRVRAVVRFANKGDGATFELDAFGDDGRPLTAHAPRSGDVAHGVGGKVTAIGIAPATHAPEELALAAAGLLATGDARAAEHLLEPGPGDVTKRAPAVDLVYARALEGADDVPENKAIERMRAAIDRVLTTWPTSWEARIDHARTTERRKGQGEGLADALRELSQGEADGKPLPSDRMSVAYLAVVARRLQMTDLVEAAYAEVAKQAPASAFVAGLDARLHPRVGADAVRAACEGNTRRADVDCLEARRSMGDLAGAKVELARLRKLRGAPEGLRETEMGIKLSEGDLRGALALYDASRPGERRLFEAVALAAGRNDKSAAKVRLARDKLVARDTPFSLAAIERALGLAHDQARELEVEGRRIVREDVKAPFQPGAGTAVLKHLERYEIEASGMTRFLVYDLRRVSGTTDVANGQGTPMPTLDARSAPRILRRRILKRDGRVLEPDSAANAQQASDLSQLETGDYIEQIVEGNALPADSGHLAIDTPDLMPERTSVREATIEVKRPASVNMALWSHPLLGKPEVKQAAGVVTETWRLRDQSPRRLEDGVARLERSVAVRLGTHTWRTIARGMGENMRAYDGDDPMIVRFAEAAAAGDRTPSLALVQRVVAAVGKAVKISVPMEMSDAAGMFSGGPQRSTARLAIEQGTGSRSWAVYRVLRQLGVAADIAAAETEPYASSPNFPAHPGRFRHPLVIAHLPAGPDGAAHDVWIDADVEGPPLPPGRVSPELRGRTAMVAGDGRMLTVEARADGAGDVVDLALTLDARGDATGTFVATIHGRAAQGLAESFETTVGTDRRELLRTFVLGWVPWADVDDVVVSSAAGSWEIVLKAQIAVHGYARPEGKDGKVWSLPGLEPVHVFYPRRFVGTLASTYASRGGRQNALSIDVPLQYALRRTIKLPAGATVARPPAALDVGDPHLAAKRVETFASGTLEDRFTLSVPTGTVDAAQYQQFVERVYRVDDGFMTGTRITVKP